MKRISLVGVPIIAAMLAGACGPTTPQNIRVCRDASGRVLDDRMCEPGASYAGGGVRPMYWYMPYVYNGYAPGSYVTGGTSSIQSGVSALSNGAIRSNPGAYTSSARGGFGSTARSFGSFGG